MRWTNAFQEKKQTLKLSFVQAAVKKILSGSFVKPNLNYDRVCKINPQNFIKITSLPSEKAIAYSLQWKLKRKKGKEKGYLISPYVKTRDLNQKPRQTMTIMQNNWVPCPQIHKIIQGINFTPTFISKTFKISYVTTA